MTFRAKLSVSASHVYDVVTPITPLTTSLVSTPPAGSPVCFGAERCARVDEQILGDEDAAAADLAEDTADEADETVGVVRHYTGDDGARGIERDGLIRPSEDGNVYLTTDIYSNGADAQAGLNLSQTPTGYFEIPLDRIPNAQGPFPVDGGTGTEILNPGGVDATGLTFNPF